MVNKHELDYIIFLVKTWKEGKDGEEYALSFNSAKYLLGQTLRQLELPKNKYLISEAAFKLWNSITDEDIYKIFYRTKVENKKSDELELDLYKGAGKKPWKVKHKLKKGDSFVYRDVFHDDHVISISTIMDKLKELENLSYENVQNLINKISVCKMIKAEDRGISKKSNRGDDERYIIEKIYYPEIKIMNYVYAEETVKI